MNLTKKQETKLNEMGYFTITIARHTSSNGSRIDKRTKKLLKNLQNQNRLRIIRSSPGIYFFYIIQEGIAKEIMNKLYQKERDVGIDIFRSNFILSTGF